MSASKIIINFGTTSAERTNHIHVLFGGKKGQEGFNIANSTFDCLDCIKEFYSDLSAQLNAIGELKVATHDELGNSNNDHLSLAIRKEFNTNIITLNISLNIIHSDSDKVYFQTMKAVIDAIENNFLEDAKHHND